HAEQQQRIARAQQQTDARPPCFAACQHKNAEGNQRQRHDSTQHPRRFFPHDLLSRHGSFSFPSLSLAFRSVNRRKSRSPQAATAIPSRIPKITTPLPHPNRFRSQSAPKQQSTGGVTTVNPT